MVLEKPRLSEWRDRGLHDSIAPTTKGEEKEPGGIVTASGLSWLQSRSRPIKILLILIQTL